MSIERYRGIKVSRNPQILVELQEHMGSDRSIAASACTSSMDLGKRSVKTDAQVEDMVRRLAADGHSTPFESVVLRFWIRWPIFSDRQHMTHRIASHNGLSGRYRTMPLDYFELPDDVLDVLKNVDGIVANPCHNPDWNILDSYYESCETAVNNYKLGIDQLKAAEKQGAITNDQFKRVREVLRGQLPTAGMVERITVMNLRSFANYQRLRNSSHAQPEIREAAQEMLRLVEESKVCPIAIEALKSVGWRI